MSTKQKLDKDVKMLCMSLVRGYTRRVNQSWILRGMVSTINISPFDILCIEAVEKAISKIGIEFQDVHMRDKLRETILDSCNNGRNFNYDYCNLPFSKTSFYRHRNKFLCEIASYLGCIHS